MLRVRSKQNVLAGEYSIEICLRVACTESYIARHTSNDVTSTSRYCTDVKYLATLTQVSVCHLVVNGRYVALVHKAKNN